MKARLQHIFLFFIPWFTAMLYGQDPVHHIIGTAEGLPSSQVYSIVQDDQGYMWGATDRGLFCYNGKSMKVFTTRDGLPSNVMYKMFKDPQGRLWVGGSNNQLAYVENGQIFQPPANAEIVKIIGQYQHEIANLGMDTEGNIVIGTYRTGIIRVLAGDYAHCRKDEEFLGLRAVQIAPNKYAMTIPKKTRLKLLFSRQESYTLKIRFEEGEKVALGQFEVREENLKFSRRLEGLKDAAGIMRIVLNSTLFSIYPNGKMKLELLENGVLFMERDRKGGLWVGTIMNGILYYPSGALSDTPLHYFKGESITDVECDREGGIWFSTLTSGLLYLPNSAIAKYHIAEGAIVGLNKVYGDLYGAYLEGDRFRMDAHGEVLKVPGTSRVLLSQVGFGGYKGEVYLYSDRSYVLDDKLGMKRMVDDEHIVQTCYGFCPTRDDKLIFVSGYNFISLTQNNHLTDTVYLNESAIRIKRFKSGEIWIGSTDGLYRYENLSVKRIYKHISAFNTRITDIEEEPMTGTIAVSTLGRGVTFIRNGEILTLDQDQGLVSELCNAVVFRNAREAWVATNQGVSRIRWHSGDLQDYSLQNYNDEHGLGSNEVGFVEVFMDRIWFGTKKGLYSADLKKELKNYVPPPIHLVESKIGDIDFKMKNGIKLEHTQNSLSFQFDVLSYRNPEKNGIAYRILGSNDELIPINGSLLTLNNLAPGVYAVEVFGINSDGEFSEQPLLLQFEILPPFYGTWWFRVLMGLGFMLIVYFLLRWRFMVQRRKDLERLRIERQLSSSQLTAIRSQMNPHFIFNAFNGIQRYVLQKDRMETYRYVSKFSTLIREVLEQSSENYISLQKEIEMLQNYVEIESLRFDNKFVFQLEIDVPEALMEYEIPAMIVQPFVENAIWHGLMPLDDRLGELVLRFSIEHRNLVIEVIDNGIGREESAKIRKKAKASSMGLRLIDERIQLVNTLQPNEPVSVWIEDLTDEHGKACGTRVSISMKLMQEE